MGGFYQPGGALRRMTPNAGNRQFIRGGFINRRLLLPPVFVGPGAGAQAWTVGVAITPIEAAPWWTGATQYAAAPLPEGVVCDLDTGTISGTPAVGSEAVDVACEVGARNGVDGKVIRAAGFAWTVGAAP